MAPRTVQIDIPHHLSWPLSADQVDALDSMLTELYRRLASTSITAIAAAASPATTATGPIGPVGPDGDEGLEGPMGPPGVVGASGAMGLRGAPGDDGLDGDDGRPGSPGPVGAQGPAGAPGLDGESVADEMSWPVLYSRPLVRTDLVPALPGTASTFLDGTGAFSTPSSGLIGVYAPGMLSLATGQFEVMSNHLILTSTQRFTGVGTSRLRLTT